MFRPVRFASLFFLPILLVAQEGFRIEVDIEGYDQETLVLAYFFGGRTFEKQVASRNDSGGFLFSAETLPEESKVEGINLYPGLYYLLYPATETESPAILFEFFIDQGEDRFRLESSMDDLVGSLSVSGDGIDSYAVKYSEFLLKNLKEQKALETIETRTVEQQAELDALSTKLDSYRRDYFTKNPESVVALFMSYRPFFEYPDFQGSQQEIDLQRYLYARQHFFDNLDLSDPRHLRFPGPLDLVDTYINRMVPQSPDQLESAVNQVIEMASGDPATFQFYVVYFLNKYADSQIMGHDSVYVGIIEDYYRSGQATWVTEERKAVLSSIASRLSPLLIGKTMLMPTLLRTDGSAFTFEDLETDWKVIFLWDPEKPESLEEAKILEAWRSQHASDKASIVAIPISGDLAQGVEQLKTAGIDSWNIGTTPDARRTFFVLDHQAYKIFILNKSNTISFKRIRAGQIQGLLKDLL